jgi:hypothetical protein
MDKKKFYKQDASPPDDNNDFDPTPFEKYRIDPEAELMEPPVLLKINGASIATLGNFSLWIGKAKSKKTFMVSCTAAAAASGSCSIAGIEGIVRSEANRVLYFDTEQSAYFAQKTIKRICRQIGIKSPSNLIAYGQRPMTPIERYKFIEHKIYNTPGLAFVVIDGIVDLLSNGINDEEEAIKLTSALLRWTEEQNIHIATVLHQNKADFNARGHIGTSLVNKSETVISVTKDDKNHDISYVKPEFCKDRDFQMLAFTINNDGLPVLLDTPPPESSKMANLQKIFEAILPSPKEMTQGRLADEYMKKTNLSKRTADSHIKYAVENEILIKDEVRKSYKMSYSPAPDQNEAACDNKLFQLEPDYEYAPF